MEKILFYFLRLRAKVIALKPELSYPERSVSYGALKKKKERKRKRKILPHTHTHKRDKGPKNFEEMVFIISAI